MEHSETELETMERWALARARQELAPPADQVGRIQAGLEAQLGLAGGLEGATTGKHGPETSSHPTSLAPDASRPRLVRTLFGPLRGAIVTGVGGVVLGLFLGLNIGRQGLPRQQVETEPRTTSDGPALRTIESSETSIVAPTYPAPNEEREQVSPDPSPARAPERALARIPSADRAPSVSESPPLYEELSYLRRAQRAMKEGEFGQALGLMVELRSLSPSGSLLSEREVTEVLALCALGRATEAQAVATRLRTRDKKLAYRSRLNGSCVGKEKPLSSDK